MLLEVFQILGLLHLMSSHQSELAFVFTLWYEEWDWHCEKAEWSGPLTRLIENKTALPITVCCFIEHYWLFHAVHPTSPEICCRVFSSPNSFHIILCKFNNRCVHGRIAKIGYSFSDQQTAAKGNVQFPWMPFASFPSQDLLEPPTLDVIPVWDLPTILSIPHEKDLPAKLTLGYMGCLCILLASYLSEELILLDPKFL